MKMRLIPPGEFLMGSMQEQITKMKKELANAGGDKTWLDTIDCEGPIHTVQLTNPMYLGTYEVTVSQFRKFVESENYKTEAERDGKGGKIPGQAWQYKYAAETSWQKPWKVPAQDDQPVLQVSWHDAQAFCKWLSEKEGQEYRLPTEAEWEFACRAGSAGLYSFGNDASEQKAYAIVNEKEPQRVGLRRPNGFGLFDMDGNAWEWCLDWFVPRYAGVTEKNPRGPETGVTRAFRGGSYHLYPWAARCAMRSSDGPSERTHDTGFRVARVGHLNSKAPFAEPGWVQLFIGKDLTGWDYLPKYWRVGGDSVTGSTYGKPINFWTNLASKRKFKDFEARFKVRLKVEDYLGRSGLFIRSNLQEGGQINVLGAKLYFGPARWGGLWRETVGAVTFPPPQSLERVVDPKDFNNYYVKCVGKHVTIRVNGVTTVDQELPWLQDDGIIAWQLNPGKPIELAIKDFWIRELSEAGWVQLFNGKDVAGWRVVGNPKNSWQVREGNLWAGGGETFLVSERKFTHFHLKAELRISPGCEGMILGRADPDDDALLKQSFAPAGLRLVQAPLLEGLSNLDVGMVTQWKEKGGKAFARPFNAGEWVRVDLIADGERLSAYVVVTDQRRELWQIDPVQTFKRGKGPIPGVPGPIILRLGAKEGSLEFRKFEIKELRSSK
jgi:formylglycine-generating enzyme required for sulfatase activity